MFSRYLTGMSCSVPMRSPLTGPPSPRPRGPAPWPPAPRSRPWPSLARGIRADHPRRDLVAPACAGDPPLPPADERPVDPTPVHTADLPAHAHPRPQHPGRRPGSRRPPSCCTSATTSGDSAVIAYKRRIGPMAALAGRAGQPGRRPLPGRRRPTTSAAQHTFRLYPDGHGEGVGPSGPTHAPVPGLEGGPRTRHGSTKIRPKTSARTFPLRP